MMLLVPHSHPLDCVRFFFVVPTLETITTAALGVVAGPDTGRLLQLITRKKQLTEQNKGIGPSDRHCLSFIDFRVG